VCDKIAIVNELFAQRVVVVVGRFELCDGAVERLEANSLGKRAIDVHLSRIDVPVLRFAPRIELPREEVVRERDVCGTQQNIRLNELLGRRAVGSVHGAERVAKLG
jgi:hypothetical protein